jgi:NAD+ kinase
LLSLKKTCLLDNETAAHLTDLTIPILPREALCQEADLLIVVGGDGNILHTAHDAVQYNVPVLGINRGRLGFLTDILPHRLDKIKLILDGQFHMEKRFLLEASVYQDTHCIGHDHALNEVALIPNSAPHMTEFEIYIDQQFVCSQDSDGLIIATPTGSTAYALSGGGPILHPQLDAIVIVPMFPHTLSMRPIVIEANQAIDIMISPNNSTAPRLSCDSHHFIEVPLGGRIHIKKLGKPLQLIHPIDYDYYESLRSKLHWGHKLKYAHGE